MAGSLAIYSCKKLLDHLFNKAAWSAPTIKVALSTADPGEDGAGLAEPSGNNYSRASTTGSTWNAATSADPSVVTNAAQIAFPTSSGSWGLCTHWALMDGDTANVIAHGTLEVPQTPVSGNVVTIESGQLSLSLD
jgi:hypothetical protein